MSNATATKSPSTALSTTKVASALTVPRDGTVRHARHVQASEDIAALLVAAESGAVTVCFRGRTLRPSDVLAGLKKRASKEANAWLDAMSDDVDATEG